MPETGLAGFVPSSIEKAMAVALGAAKTAAAAGEVPIGAAVFDCSGVLAAAGNTRERDGDPTGHAEMVALREAAKIRGGWRLEDCGMAVTLEPCPMCAGALVNARVKVLAYGATDPKAGAVGSLYNICQDPRLNHRLAVLPGIAEQEAEELLSEFFRCRRSTGPAR